VLSNLIDSLCIAFISLATFISSSSLKLGSKNLRPILLNNSSIPVDALAEVSLKTAPISAA
jgi:hypothetical protein